MIVTLGGGVMGAAFTHRMRGTLGLRSQLRRQPLLDFAIGGAAARRVVAEAGGEIGDAGAPLAVDPEARAQAVGIAGMANERAAIAERVVAGRTLGEDLHREA